jgi:hypothetical protein
MGARYLTDGAHFYRDLGLRDGSHELVVLENCLSLEVLPMSARTCVRSTIRAVEPELVHEPVLIAAGREYSRWTVARSHTGRGLCRYGGAGERGRMATSVCG